jgi:hypothetical protein
MRIEGNICQPQNAKWTGTKVLSILPRGDCLQGNVELPLLPLNGLDAET